MAKKNTPAPRPNPQPTRRPAPKPTNKSESPANTGWLRFVLAALLITAACYFPSISNGFVNWDDDPNITENPNLEMVGKGQPWGQTISNIFSIDKGAVIGNYNPLPILTFAVEKSLAGGENSAKLIHFNNLWLHLLTTFLAMLLLHRLGFGMWGALAGGLLFGIHPMRVESVAWATERKDVLFAAFFFAALVYYTKWLRQKERGESRIMTYALMFLMALLSGLSKVQAVTLPLSMLAIDYWLRRPLRFNLILEKAPFWALSLVIGSVNLYTLRAQGSTTDEITNFNLLDRLCIGAYSLCVYAYKLVLPWPMSPLYPYPKPLPIQVYLAPLAFAAMCYGFWYAWKKDLRIWVFGVAFFFFNVMFLLQVLGAGQGFLADRFTYVPYFGMFAIAAFYFEKMYADPSKRGLAQGILGAVGLIFAIWTVRQIGIWENGETLWSHVMRYEQKSNSLPYWNRGQYYRNQGKYDVALKDYTEAVTINPKNPELYNSRGKTYFDMAMSGKYKSQEADLVQKALSDYGAAVALPGIKDKTKAEILINRGAANGAVQRFDQAIKDVTDGLAIDPNNKNGYFNRSIAYFSLRQFDKALADYKSYIKIDPNNANVWYEAGMIQRAMSQNDGAVNDLTQAIRLNPNMGIAYLERARAQAQKGNKSAAQQDYQRAAQLGAKQEAFDAQLMGK